MLGTRDNTYYCLTLNSMLSTYQPRLYNNHIVTQNVRYLITHVARIGIVAIIETVPLGHKEIIWEFLLLWNVQHWTK